VTQTIVVDTDVCSYAFRGDSRFAFYEDEMRGKTATISFMTLAELRFWSLVRRWGVDRQRQFNAFLEQRFVIHPVDELLCSLWADLTFEARQQGRALQSADAWVAATAVKLGVPLLTHNAKDFSYITGLQVITATME
jgi:predicted nucleic acid-binding protein